MITCRQLAELLLDFSSGELPAQERERVETHLRLCSCCVAYLESYRCTIQMTRGLPRAPLPPHLVQPLRALLENLGRGPGDEGRRNSYLGETTETKDRTGESP